MGNGEVDGRMQGWLGRTGERMGKNGWGHCWQNGRISGRVTDGGTGGGGEDGWGHG